MHEHTVSTYNKENGEKYKEDSKDNHFHNNKCFAMTTQSNFKISLILIFLMKVAYISEVDCNFFLSLFSHSCCMPKNYSILKREKASGPFQTLLQPPNTNQSHQAKSSVTEKLNFEVA